MKTVLSFIIFFTTLLGYAQNSNDANLFEKKELFPIDLPANLNQENTLIAKDDFPKLLLYNHVQDTLAPSSKRNRNVISKQQEYTLRLDKYVTANWFGDDSFSKREYTYDENGKETLYINYLYDTTTLAFVPSYKREQTYDENGNQTIYIGSWNTTTLAFVPSSKNEYTYDENGNQTLYVDYSWNTTTLSFVPFSKQEYTYDENGKRTLYIYYSWNTTTSSFEPSSKQEYYYDSNGKLTLYINYSWNTTTHAFVPSSKNEYTYDENGKRTLYIDYSWNTTTLAFVPSSKQEYTYDENGNETLYIDYSWDTATSSLVPSSKNEYTHDANGNLTISIPYTWNTTNQSFVPSIKQENTYDTKGNRILITDYKWYADLGVYKPSFKKQYSTSLDNATNRVEMGTLFKYDTNFNKWNELTGEEYKSYRYYTKTAILSTDAFNSPLFVIYPNPTSDYIYIKTTEEHSNLQLELFDLSGKKILSQPIISTEAIDIHDLTPSMYLYNISDGKSLLKSGKIIKK